MEPTWHQSAASDTAFVAYDMSEPSPSSLLLTMLPSLLQRRIPRFRSLKRAHTEPAGPRCHTRMSSCSTVGSTTPPPSYRATVPGPESSDEEGPVFQPFNSHLPQQKLAFSRPSSSQSMAPPYPSEDRTNIQWKYAETGYSLLSLSLQEASTTSPGANLVRQQYISGVACILRGLPAELTADEELSLREALPSSVCDAVISCATFSPQAKRKAGGLPSDSRLARGRADSEMMHSYSTSAGISPRPTLQRAVATLTCYLFLAVAFILPYLQLLVQQAYLFDRRHKLSDKVLAKGVAAADAAGRQAVVLATNVCALNEGRVGEAMRAAGGLRGPKLLYWCV